MSVSHNCPCTEECPLQHAVEMIGGKWKLPILCALAVDGSTRYNDLKRKLGGISNTMLAKSLKLDPAVMASPFITSIVDALSLLV